MPSQLARHLRVACELVVQRNRWFDMHGVLLQSDGAKQCIFCAGGPVYNAVNLSELVDQDLTRLTEAVVPARASTRILLLKSRDKFLFQPVAI